MVYDVFGEEFYSTILHALKQMFVADSIVEDYMANELLLVELCSNLIFIYCYP